MYGCKSNSSISKRMKIEKVNAEIRKCHKCRLSETRINALCGEGNIDGTIMLIAQAPGQKEDREGKMFLGPSGQVLDELLSKTNIERREIYMTNLIKCMLPKNRRPKIEEIKLCSQYLDTEIELISPTLMAPLGYYATKYIFEKYALGVPSKAQFPVLCGRPHLAEGSKILPLQHPAAALYNNSLKEAMAKNYSKINTLTKDCKWFPVCPMKRYYVEGKLGKEWIERYCKGDWESCKRYQLEERREVHPDWMLPDGTIDENLHTRF
jgi:uracil-DNA glycosylase family 4